MADLPGWGHYCEGESVSREGVIAHLMSLAPPANGHLLYMGEPVDATWPPEALLAMVHEMHARVRRQDESHLRSLEMLSLCAGRK